MEKTPRYTQRERNMVLGYAAQYKDIIENKRTDAESNRRKDEVWRNIAKEFNSRVYHQRTAKQLRQLYKNMKLLLKKDLTMEGRTKNFMDILNALSTQTNYLHNPFVSYRQNFKGEFEEFDDDEPKASGLNYKMSSDQILDPDVVIKSEEICDTDEHSFQNDDTMSNKDIPEVCIDEDDDYYDVDSLNNLNRISNQPSATAIAGKNDAKCDSLLQLAMEERKRKIDLLNAQIDYWKALTKKLESTTSHCHCHMPPARVNGVNPQS